MAQVVRFWTKIRRLGPSDSQIEKWHPSLIKQNLTEQTLVQQQYKYQVHTGVRVAIDALD